ncbi:acyl-CoA dehydratase activase-related protein [Lutispora thermophila]|uniref:Predicted nucleotide-binding protein, sugar kinase/HSP70/actin superfamily n=1 Tax=Lutispora thermophila DSM 19022 TaxID=1122184 RepID=A0A1M6B2M0_9FIRM|nr:acyl-CoA dehydratase activase-related protein [Lutispora thermophila]SHI42703.1 Predicted nucleotide-binding protein, sugar kinase/HSP70/actin superfamily [Lutispora thermophila DSM 19022]
MKVGIPRALLFYYYYPLWKTFFEELGCEVVTSGNTTKELIDKGIKASVPEICVPIKILNGHVLELLDSGVDYVFIPRMMSIRKGEFFCPKFMGLPDMVRHSLPGAQGKVLYPKISSLSDDISDDALYLELGEALGVSHKQIKEALKEGREVWKKFRNKSKEGHTIAEAMDYVMTGKEPEKQEDCTITIGLMGYVYDVYDEFVSMGIVDKLKDMGVRVLTFEMMDEEMLDRELDFMKKRLFWTFSNKLLAAGYKFLKDKNIDGVIHVTAFGCGPDSLIGKLMEIDSIEYGKPFMTIRVDEHTGENHLLTRIEAFVDMIQRKKVKSLKEAE